jgi:hypothetical protein
MSAGIVLLLQAGVAVLMVANGQAGKLRMTLVLRRPVAEVWRKLRILSVEKVIVVE